jgi:CPA1 family monovalent cation:H+ antiporter
MTFFESLIALLLVAVVLLQIARRLSVPYPAMLALAGAGVAFVPGIPTIGLDPATALPLFIAPVLLDAAFDFPLETASRLWRPLLIMVVGAVLVTTAVVAWIGVAAAGLPLAAAVVLGAIVAPPDAAAATAVARTVSLPRRTVAVLNGESLLNDATALLLFSGALALQMGDGGAGKIGTQLALAVPGGIFVGVVLAWVVGRINRLVVNTLGGNLLQFVAGYAVWLIAEHLHFSAILAVVSFAVAVARTPQSSDSPRMRVQSFAVWAAVVFVLNVTALLLMGLQAHTIIARLPPGRLGPSLRFAGLVILGVIASRFAVVMTWNWFSRRFRGVRGGLAAPSVGGGIFVSWCGMRGLVTLITAFALPPAFPQRDLVVLAAFAVVLATLVGQGLTLVPMIRMLGLDRVEDPDEELKMARKRLVEAALDRLGDHRGATDLVRYFEAKRDRQTDPDRAQWLKDQRQAGLDVVRAQREELRRMRAEDAISVDSFYFLQEELDWRNLTLLPDEDRRIDEA